MPNLLSLAFAIAEICAFKQTDCSALRICKNTADPMSRVASTCPEFIHPKHNNRLAHQKKNERKGKKVNKTSRVWDWA